MKYLGTIFGLFVVLVIYVSVTKDLNVLESLLYSVDLIAEGIKSVFSFFGDVLKELDGTKEV